MIKNYLKNDILVTDGAMGTYYAQISGRHAEFSEMANLTHPEVILNIHREYIEAGARLIRTNTFSANTYTLKISKESLKEILIKGYELAHEACKGSNVFIAADIGPIPELINNKEVDKKEIIEEYKLIVDTFMESGAKIFVFETFSSIDYLEEITSYIKQKNKDIFIITQFVVMADGYTRKGMSAAKIAEQAKNIQTIDAYGFNCGTGPTPLYNNIKEIDFHQDIVSVLPNAGFPEIINERTVYSQNEEYFADRLLNIKNLGVKIIGGCCGTTPVHIRKITEKINSEQAENDISLFVPRKKIFAEFRKEEQPYKNEFSNKLKQNKFVVAVELDPPSSRDLTKIMNGANMLKEHGADVITISDSPLARARVNSVMAAAKIKREIGIDVIPHICCRDRNIIALKSDMLAAHIEGIRNILVVTGDPISSAEKSEIKSVFNLNSLKLMMLLKEMNQEQFKEEPYCIGGALNLNVHNKDVEVSRMYKKAENGANFFLTQPIFDDEVINYLRGLKRASNIKILGGIMPIVSYRNAQFLNNEIPGIKIPDRYIQMFNEKMTRDEAEKIGIHIAVDIADKMKKHVDGFYFVTPFNRTNIITEIMKEVL